MNQRLECVCLGLAALALALVPALQAADKPDPEGFIPRALAGGIHQIEVAKLAEKHAGSDAVKEFARRVIKDHSEANARLMEFAKEMKVAVVEGATKDQREKKTQLSKLNGIDFDREFLRTMEADHKEAISLFENEAKNGKDGKKVQEFAEKTLPTLRDHLKMARKLLDDLKAK